MLYSITFAMEAYTVQGKFFKGLAALAMETQSSMISYLYVMTASKRNYKQMMQKKFRPHLVTAFLIPFFQQVTENKVVTFYVLLWFRTIGLGETASLMCTVMTGVVGTGSFILAMLLVDWLGRWELFLIGIVMAAQLGDNGAMIRGYTWIVLVVICVYIAGFGLSWEPLAWLVPSEIFRALWSASALWSSSSSPLALCSSSEVGC
ncbi:Major facilitator sugar transporter-like protein [Dioscorea alata]|uniref:Major facilitator sugar transporter-like protein n=1 Tax=Dioscorea alata TaxID=55571 RepID=A0ACB7V5F5_DIOAL|nr:Major facilitator sugar transporter-like protein [Dioscorea alata]